MRFEKTGERVLENVEGRTSGKPEDCVQREFQARKERIRKKGVY